MARQAWAIERGSAMNWDRTIGSVAPYAAVAVAILLTMVVFFGYVQFQ